MNSLLLSFTRHSLFFESSSLLSQGVWGVLAFFVAFLPFKILQRKKEKKMRAEPPATGRWVSKLDCGFLRVLLRSVNAVPFAMIHSSHCQNNESDCCNVAQFPRECLRIFGCCAHISGGVPTTPLHLILLQKYADTYGSRIVIQVGDLQLREREREREREGVLSQKYRDRNGRCIAILFESVGVGGRFDSRDISRLPFFISAVNSRICGVVHSQPMGGGSAYRTLVACFAVAIG